MQREIAPHFLGSIELVVHKIRPNERRDGARLVADAMAIVANDACQRARVVPSLGWDRDERDRAMGYVEDARSVRTLRILLAALNRVTRSARPSTTGMVPGHAHDRTETTARAASEAVQSE